MKNRKRIKPINFQLFEKFDNAPTSVFEIKYCFFLPQSKIFKPNKNGVERIVYDDGQNYRISAIGSTLTQVHRNILDIILYFGEKEFEKDSFLPMRRIKISTIQKHLGWQKKNNYGWVIEKINELKTSSIIVRSYENINKGQSFNLIDEYEFEDEIEEKTKNSEYTFIFSEKYLNFLEKTFSIKYEAYIKDIIALKHAQTQAVVRYMISFFENHYIKIPKLFAQIGISGSDQMMRIYMKNVIEELEHEGKKFGITIQRSRDFKKNEYSKYTISYSKAEAREKVYIAAPISELKKQIHTKKNVVTQETAQKTA